MTRSRATNPDLVPTDLMVRYYAQRASAGLLITEGTWVNRESIGYIHVPGIYSEPQVEGWKKVTKAVHEKGGRIFLQLGHVGPVSHPDLLGGALPVGPSAVNPEAQPFTPTGFKPTETPQAMTLEDVQRTISDYKKAGGNAKRAGFDGIELHGSMNYLIPSFFNPATNLRTDRYGGSMENRSRFALEILSGLTEVWGAHRVGIKLTPALVTGVFVPGAEVVRTYDYLVARLNELPLAYLHLVNPQTLVDGTAFEAIKAPIAYFRSIYKGVLLAGGGYTQKTAEAVISSGNADLVAFGNLYISNPDLVERFRNEKPLTPADQNTFYQGGAEGYITYGVAP